MGALARIVGTLVFLTLSVAGSQLLNYAHMQAFKDEPHVLRPSAHRKACNKEQDGG